MSIRNAWQSYHNNGIIPNIWKGITGQLSNEVIADQNLDFQRENLDYQKALQQQIFEREDTAYQRTVQDMRRAGLNPLSMQGTNGAGEAIATQPLNNQAQAYNNLGLVSELMNTVNQLKNISSNTSLNNANADLVQAQANNQKIKNLFESDILSNTLNGIKFENIGKRFKNERENIAWHNDFHNYLFNRQFGVSDNMPDLMKTINIFTHQSNDMSDFVKEYDRNPDNIGLNFNRIGNYSFNTFENALDKVPELKGALKESKLGKIFLELLGIGL